MHLLDNLTISLLPCYFSFAQQVNPPSYLSALPLHARLPLPSPKTYLHAPHTSSPPNNSKKSPSSTLTLVNDASSLTTFLYGHDLMTLYEDGWLDGNWNCGIGI